MDKILVTTDLSTNSKAAMRFAINLSQQKKLQLIFLHVHQVLRASTWSDAKYDYYLKEDKNALMEELQSFVSGVYRSMKIEPEKIKHVVHHNFNVTEGIRKYAKENKCNYICIATRGAGSVKKLFGTHTGKLITSSEVPVICVPTNYRTKPVSKLLYASDMTDYEKELKQVVSFAKPLKATVEMLHLSFPYEFIADEAIAEKELKKKMRYDIDIHYQSRDIENSLLQDMEKAVKKARPSLVVMFTKQKRSFFEKLFLSSKAAEYSFTTKVPLLIYSKG